MQKEYASSLPIARFHACVCGSHLAGGPPIIGKSGCELWLKEVLLECGAIPISAGPGLLNDRGTVNLLDRDAAFV